MASIECVGQKRYAVVRFAGYNHMARKYLEWKG